MKTTAELEAIAAYRAVRNEAGKDALKAMLTFFVLIPAAIGFFVVFVL
jgi:hypothetical protein